MSRSRQPRPNHSQDADEEKRLWNHIKAEAKKADTLIARSGSIGNEIVEIEKQQGLLIDADKPSDAALDERLETLYRENVRISEQIQHMLEGKSDETNLLDNLRILAALRESAEETMPLSIGPGRPGSMNGIAKSRSALAKRKGAAGSVITDDGEDSAAPSPRLSAGRLGAGPGKDKVRGGSAAPSVREVSVKIEDGAESVADSIDDTGNSSRPPSESGNPGTSRGSKDSSTPLTPTTLQQAQRQYLIPGAMVFCRNKGRAQEGEGMLCRVTSVIGEGKQRRYEIQDADPDSEPAQGETPAPYRASVSHLIPIPTSNLGLSDLSKGRNVLAQYPDTTTFYKAEVSTPWRIKDMAGDKGVHVRLRFEGEMEEAKETEVERRFVVSETK